MSHHIMQIVHGGKLSQNLQISFRLHKFSSKDFLSCNMMFDSWIEVAELCSK